MSKFEKLVETLLVEIGGKENIISVVHCMTRLRFKLRDESKANTAAIEQVDGVIAVVKSGGQYQIVIGKDVADVYQELMQQTGMEAQKALDINENDDKHTNLFDAFIDTVSSIFQPALGVLAAGGIIKGLLTLFVTLGLLSKGGGTFHILNATGDAIFQFLPILLAFTAAKKFKLTPLLAMTIGAALLYPSITGGFFDKSATPLYILFSGTIFESPVHITFLKIPVILMNYTQTVMPIIFAIFIGAKVERLFKKFMPKLIAFFMVPAMTLVVMVPLSFLVIGPVTVWAGDIVGLLINAVYNFAPWLAGGLLGGFWQVLVMFGLHWGVVPLGIMNRTQFGYDTILVAIAPVSFAQIGVVLAIIVRTKNQQLKELAIPAFISGIFGITEPAIYGVTLPRKKPFILSCIAGAIGGIVIALFGTKSYVQGGLSFFGIPAWINPNSGVVDMSVYGGILAMLIAFVIGFILQYFFGGSVDDKAHR